MLPDRLIETALRNIADGAPVDWNGLDACAESDDDRAWLRSLRVLDDVAVLHRSVGDDTPAPGGPTLPAGPAHGPIADGTEPRMWGQLELRQELGKGSYGVVYRAWDPALEREVALKILHGPSDALMQEARLLAQVRHPNVVAVYGVDEIDGSAGVRMELVDGVTVRQSLATRGVLGAREAALMGIDLCRAVAAVHKAGLLHRDIKPQNVMREAGGRIVLMDFGAGEVRVARAGTPRRTIGTPLYLAPEVLGGAPATIASEIYSLGVFLYHLVTLRYPFEGETLEAVGAAHASGRLTPLADYRPDLPAAFTRIVERALEHDPAHRHRSVGAMQQDLLSVLELDVTSGPTPDGQATASRAGTPSIAVLPFVNLGPDQGIEYFCNGLAEELLMGLGKIQGLRVASRTSSFAVKQTDADIRSICRQLDVHAVLEGTVRKAGDRLRITAQLVSATDGCHLWSEGYDRQMSDVFAVQDEIARSVLDRLQITLSGFPRQPLVRWHTDNPRAHHAYLKGRFYWSRRYHGGLTTALEQFQQAIAEDAGYAVAHAGLADAYVFIGFYSLQPPRAAFVAASAAVERALAIAPDLPEAHTSLALIRLGHDWNWPEAEREFKRALELDPSQALARVYLSWLTVLLDDASAGVMHARAAQEMDPLSPLVNSGTAYTLFLARRYEDAVVECRRCLEIDPQFIIAIYVMGMCRAQQGRLAEAIELLEQAVAMSGRAPFYLGLLGNLYGRVGDGVRVQALRDELERLTTTRYVPPHCFTYLYAGINDLDRAFEWQARAHEDGASPFNYFSPIIENLHADPRHAAELRRMGLGR
jgi:serine/threonine-protein kinase